MDTITTIATVPAVLALVNFAKALGVTSGRVALALAVVLGVALNVANYYFGNAPVYQTAIQGLILGLSAAGLWDTARAINSTPSK